MKLSDVFGSPESHSDGAIMFVDMTDSTAMKEQESEATWLTTYAWFFDLVRDKVIESSGNVVKYLGDGVMAYFGMREVANAINCAILIQEELKKADRHKKVYVSCTIGIATGKFRTFQTPEGARDYIGTTVDKAARLGASASPNAIFVDKSTINSAMMINVKSKLGDLLNWGVDDYTGNQQLISLKGFIQPVPYNEIKWDQQLFGIKSSVVTHATETRSNPTQQQLPPPPVEDAPVRIKSNQPQLGMVKSWNQGKFGFIISESTKDEYYTNPYHVMNGKELSVGQRILFIPREPFGQHKNPLAAMVIICNERYSGIITKINLRDTTKQLATITLSDSNHNTMDFFAFLGENEQGIERGDTVEFIASFNSRGPRAEDPCKSLYAQV